MYLLAPLVLKVRRFFLLFLTATTQQQQTTTNTTSTTAATTRADTMMTGTVVVGTVVVAPGIVVTVAMTLVVLVMLGVGSVWLWVVVGDEGEGAVEGVGVGEDVRTCEAGGDDEGTLKGVDGEDVWLWETDDNSEAGGDDVKGVDVGDVWLGDNSDDGEETVVDTGGGDGGGEVVGNTPEVSEIEEGEKEGEEEATTELDDCWAFETVKVGKTKPPCDGVGISDGTLSELGGSSDEAGGDVDDDGGTLGEVTGVGGKLEVNGVKKGEEEEEIEDELTSCSPEPKKGMSQSLVTIASWSTWLTGDLPEHKHYNKQKTALHFSLLFFKKKKKQLLWQQASWLKLATHGTQPLNFM